jgi:hypothetical protein
VRLAYADPPYFGQGGRYDHEAAAIWNDEKAHLDLVDQLVAGFPDGWALSLSTPSLRWILPHCPDDARIAAWVKPFAVFKPNVNPAYAWEPVIFRGGRRGDRDRATVRDWLSCNITLRKGLVGAKPPEFCQWVLDLLGYDHDTDEMVDIFPGTGVMGVVADRSVQIGMFGEASA